jgi:acyl-CoA synthetase (AMP-forming)/AMP-acid ligase II
VAVLDPNTHYHPEAAYGSMRAGAIHRPLNYRLVEEDFEYILNDAGVDANYADHECADRIEAVRDEVPTETFVTNDASEVGGSGSRSTEVVADPAGYERPEMSEDRSSRSTTPPAPREIGRSFGPSSGIESPRTRAVRPSESEGHHRCGHRISACRSSVCFSTI